MTRKKHTSNQEFVSGGKTITIVNRRQQFSLQKDIPSFCRTCVDRAPLSCPDLCQRQHSSPDPLWHDKLYFPRTWVARVCLSREERVFDGSQQMWGSESGFGTSECWEPEAAISTFIEKETAEGIWEIEQSSHKWERRCLNFSKLLCFS